MAEYRKKAFAAKIGLARTDKKYFRSTISL
jgi:hypothetical protein